MDRTGRKLRRELLLRRVANQVAAEARAEVADALHRLAELLARQSPQDVSAGWQARRVASLTKQADEILTSAYSRINALSRDALIRVARSEVQATEADVLSAIREAGGEIDGVTMRLPSPSLLRAIVTERPVEGDVMWNWWRRQRIATRQAFRTQIQLGLTRGESTDDMVRRIRGKSIGGGRFVGGVLETSTRQAQALVRTAVTQVSNTAAYESYRENPDLTEEYEYVATLDSRTTEICASLDGQRFRYDDPAAPRPPQHWNCRSTIIPVLNLKGLGLSGGKTPPRQTYPEWFADQPAGVQDDILGRGRAALVRSGQASFTDLVRSDGSRVPLSALE